MTRPGRVRLAGAVALPCEVALWLVEARETNPPDAADPAHWLLLTTHAVPNLAAARQITRFYRQRWIIEQLFRVMKTKGFDIEASQVEEGGPFENLAAATLIAAIQVLQMVRERDGAAHQPLTDVFDQTDQPAMAQNLRQPRRQDTTTEKPASAGFSRLRRVDLRPPRWLDRLLRQTRTHYHPSWQTPLDEHASWLEDPETCVNPEGLDPRVDTGFPKKMRPNLKKLERFPMLHNREAR